MSLVTQFSKMHQYDDRHSYKDAWQIWLKDQEELIEREVSRLQLLGYKGDVLDKMFKAGRYYFREKVDGEKEVEKANVKKEKRDYIVMDTEVIKAMDVHLTSVIKQIDFKPAKGYAQFCEEQMDLLRREIIRLTQDNANLNKEKLAEKLKKTYKNRYYILTNV